MCLVVLVFGCDLDIKQGYWEFVTVIDSIYNGNNWTTTINYNGDLYDFYTTTETTDSCWVFICNGEILDMRA